MHIKYFISNFNLSSYSDCSCDINILIILIFIKYIKKYFHDIVLQNDKNKFGLLESN